MQETQFGFLGWEDLLEKGWLPTPVFLGFPCGSDGKESLGVSKQEYWSEVPLPSQSLGKSKSEAQDTSLHPLGWLK